MGTISEELFRRFNEENNEEAGEHWTPRGAWYRPASVKIGYEISFNRHFYKPTLEDIPTIFLRWNRKHRFRLTKCLER